MKPFKHKDCLGVRGIKSFKCTSCNKETTNYLNGVDMCNSCCEEKKICRVCGNKVEETNLERGIK